MQLAPKLLPFWFTPEFQEGTAPVKFRLRPLTQAEMIEVEELYGEHGWTRAAQFRAGMLSIIACENIVAADGKPVRWPDGIEVPGTALRGLIAHCGMRIIVEMNGNDWSEIIGLVESRADKQPAEASPEKT